MNWRPWLAKQLRQDQLENLRVSKKRALDNRPRHCGQLMTSGARRHKRREAIELLEVHQLAKIRHGINDRCVTTQKKCPGASP